MTAFVLLYPVDYTLLGCPWGPELRCFYEPKTSDKLTSQVRFKGSSGWYPVCIGDLTLCVQQCSKLVSEMSFGKVGVLHRKGEAVVIFCAEQVHTYADFVFCLNYSLCNCPWCCYTVFKYIVTWATVCPLCGEGFVFQILGYQWIFHPGAWTCTDFCYGCVH